MHLRSASAKSAVLSGSPCTNPLCVGGTCCCAPASHAVLGGRMYRAKRSAWSSPNCCMALTKCW
eukprot:1948460-Amphidinium_carterae.1